MIANEISLKKLIIYNNSVYDINEKFKGLQRENSKAKTKASTVAKTMLASMMCGHTSINELININKCKKTQFKMLYKQGEYIPKMHGLRDCIMDTDYKQIEEINNKVIEKIKENKVIRNNKVDGLVVVAWDGVDLNETTKDIKGLPEKEYDKEIRKYIKYECAMNIGEKANIILNIKPFEEVDKVTSKTGKERAKTIGETKAFERMFEETERKAGGCIDVHVMDALYLDQYVTNRINDKGKYFVIRLKDETRDIYQDAKGLFEAREADKKYEIIEHIITKDIKYNKNAKKKDEIKTKIRREIREITSEKLNEKRLIKEKTVMKKNSIIKVTEYERVIIRKEVWFDEFELTGYKGKVRVVRSKETSMNGKKEKVQEIYAVTNMLYHDVETILKIMHLRWNIENCGFRTLKQRHSLEHIFIGELNAINYIVQMIVLAFNLFELYTKVRLKEEVTITWSMVTRLFEDALHNDKNIKILFSNTS